MPIDWTPLDRELSQWIDAGLTLPLWLRDDDAVAPTPALTRLVALSARTGMDVHLAVIPAQATGRLGNLVAAEPRLIPLVHGWAHVNHARPGAKKAEFGADRAAATCLAEARAGLARLEALFGGRLCRMFVPPWNRIAPEVTAGLAETGFHAVSTFGPRASAVPYPGLAQINTHCDPVNWRAGRSMLAPEVIVAHIVATLSARRAADTDPDEPFGILTHHLVTDDAIWAFCEELLDRLLVTVGRPFDIVATGCKE